MCLNLTVLYTNSNQLSKMKVSENIMTLNTTLLKNFKVKGKVILRPTVSRPVRLGVRHTSGTHDQFFILLGIFFRQLLVLASAVSRDTRPYFIVQIPETPSTWRARSPYLYPPGTGWASYTPGHWVPFPSPLTTRRATVVNVRLDI
jgi:hypothetical protein